MYATSFRYGLSISQVRTLKAGMMITTQEAQQRVIVGSLAVRHRRCLPTVDRKEGTERAFYQCQCPRVPLTISNVRQLRQVAARVNVITLAASHCTHTFTARSSIGTLNVCEVSLGMLLACWQIRDRCALAAKHRTALNYAWPERSRDYLLSEMASFPCLVLYTQRVHC